MLDGSSQNGSPLEDITVPDIIPSRMRGVGHGLENNRRAISMQSNPVRLIHNFSQPRQSQTRFRQPNGEYLVSEFLNENNGSLEDSLGPPPMFSGDS